MRGYDFPPRKFSRKDFFNWWKEEMEPAGRASRISTVNGERKSKSSFPRVLPSGPSRPCDARGRRCGGGIWPTPGQSVLSFHAWTHGSWRRQQSAEEVVPLRIGEESPSAVLAFDGPTELYVSAGRIPHAALAEPTEQGVAVATTLPLAPAAEGLAGPADHYQALRRGEHYRRQEGISHACLRATGETASPCCQGSGEKIVREPWLLSFPQTAPKIWMRIPVRAWAEWASTQEEREDGRRCGRKLAKSRTDQRGPGEGDERSRRLSSPMMTGGARWFRFPSEGLSVEMPIGILQFNALGHGTHDAPLDLLSLGGERLPWILWSEGKRSLCSSALHKPAFPRPHPPPASSLRLPPSLSLSHTPTSLWVYELVGMGETVDSAVTNNAKRVRDESGESPESKRFRAADLILLDILEDVDSADRNLAALAAGDLAVVLKSFEEEITALSPHRSQEPQQQVKNKAPQPPPSTSTSDSDGLRQSDLDYLLEASDDELGLPPTSPPSDEREVTEDDLGNEATQGFGQIWGLDDEIPNYYEAMGFEGFGQADDKSPAVGTDGVAFDGGLFEYPGAPDFPPDCLWRPESQPAV
ncbi:hypothetical protein Taro_041110 [Colocasia esculenta]|uniref:Uncharacterized protein n=1 Tax=Colocasia esculenta TaxID=4460 RepID=A0A843WUX0_COLES|nr:hypothetical protein [Colocasia esculenta]